MTHLWNPRYIAYVAATAGGSAEECLARDTERYPGGKMCGFQVWISTRWAEWRLANQRKPHDPLSLADHESFDRSIGAAVLEESGAPV